MDVKNVVPMGRTWRPENSMVLDACCPGSRSERLYGPGENWDVALTRETTEQAYEEAGISAEQLDVVELHDAFTIEEIMYAEAMGLSLPGRAAADITAGKFDIGGRCALSPSGGLLSMGHPIGPTGVGQIAEVTR